MAVDRLGPLFVLVNHPNCTKKAIRLIAKHLLKDIRVAENGLRQERRIINYMLKHYGR